MLNHSPGAYIRIGNGDPSRAVARFTTPADDFNDAIPALGASLFAARRAASSPRR